MRHIEDAHQEALIRWADRAPLHSIMDSYSGKIGDYLVAIPNGGKRNAKEGARFKKQGVRAGFPDLFLFVPVGKYAGLAIEMKKPIVKGQSKPSVSESQQKWISRLTETGYLAVVCYGWDVAKDTIIDYLAGNV